MKHLIVAIIFISLSNYSNAQEKIRFLDAKNKPTRESRATTIQQELKLSDTCWEFNIYPPNGPMYVSMRTLDEQGTVLNGRYIHYNSEGNCDTIGQYDHGIRNGTWFINSPAGRVMTVLKYDKGIIKSKQDSARYNAEWIKTNDSLIGRTRNSVEVESEFAGGLEGWNQYLSQHMKYPNKAADKNAQGTAIVFFVVDKTGRIIPDEIYIDHSVEFYIDREALRLIHESPDWSPSTVDGKPVKAYKKQPFVFKFTTS